jgi:hypothetical protein
MMSRRSICLGLSAALFMGLGACQTLVSGRVATVDLGDPATRSTVASILAAALGRGRVELGPTDGDETTVITVLPLQPGPFETNSTAVPVRFDIELKGGVCYAVRHDTGKAYALSGVECKPV